MIRQKQIVNRAALLALGWMAIVASHGDGLRADQPAPAPVTPGNSSNNQSQIQAGQKEVNDLLSKLLSDKIPEEPKKLPGTINVSPPAAFNMATVDQARLSQVGSAIARQLRRENDAGTRQLLIEAGTRIVAENDRRDQERSAQPPPTKPLNFDGNAYRQLVQHVEPVSAQAVGISSPEPAREIARVAFEGAASGTATTVTPVGTRFFSGKMEAMNDPTPYNPVPVLPSMRVSDLGGSVPSPVITEEQSPQTTIVFEKGVRIQYDETALDLACQQSDLLQQIQDRLLGDGKEQNLSETLAWASEQMAAVQNKSSQPVRITAVSLKAVCDAAVAYQNDWNALPDNLRHPGTLHRLYGFVVDSKRGDLVLLGDTDGTGEAINLDDLIAGFRAVWKIGLPPICTLEPTPGELGGPQRAFVSGVEKSTHFAHVMLDADYELKRLLFGGESVDGFRSLKDIVAEHIASGDITNWQARFWFTPVQPGEGEIRLSLDGRAGLFNATVQVLTEDMATDGGILVGKGTQNVFMAEATSQYTRQFARLTKEVPVVAQLQGLFDIVLLANVMKTAAVPNEIVNRLLELPEAHEQVPDSYTGLTVAVESNGIAFFHMAGGVTMNVSLNSRAITRSEDPAINNLAQELPASGATLPVPTTLRTQVDRSEYDLVEAGRFAASGDYSRALSLLDGLVSRDPTVREYYRLRSRIYAHMSLYRLAAEELLAAARLAPQDPALGPLSLQLALERGDSIDPLVLDGAAGDRVADLYLTEAYQQLVAGSFVPALDSLTPALNLRPKRVDLLTARAMIHANMKNWPQAFVDLAAAIRLNPASSSPYLMRASLNLQLHHPAEAIADASSVLGREPDSTEAHLIRADAELSQSPPDSDHAYRDVQAALDREPDNARALIAQSEILSLEGDRDGALAAANRAVKKSPGMATPYAVRASIYAEKIFQSQGEFAEHSKDALVMLNDLNKALTLAPADARSRRLRVDLVLEYADNFGDPEINNWDLVLPVLIKNTLISSRGALEILSKIQAPSNADEAQRTVSQYKAAATLFSIDELELVRNSTRQNDQGDLLKKIASLRASLR